MTFWNRWLKRAALGLIAGALFLAFATVVYWVRQRVVDDRRISFPSEKPGPSEGTLSFDSDVRTGRILLSGPEAAVVKTIAPGPDWTRLSQNQPEIDLQWDPSTPGIAHATLSDPPGRTRLLSLAGNAGSVFEWRGTLPKGTWFHSRIGRVASERAIRFSLVLDDAVSGESKTFFSEMMPAPRHDFLKRNRRWSPSVWRRIASDFEQNKEESWRGVQADLSQWGGKSVRIRLITVFSGSEENDESGLILWGAPELRFPEAAPAVSRFKKNPLDIPILLTLFESTPDDVFNPQHAGPPRVTGFLREAASFPIFYTTDVRSNQSLEKLLHCSTAAWPMALARQGYRTRAVGAFSDDMVRLLDRAGFEEIRLVPHDGFDPIRAAGQAASWVRNASTAGDFILLYFADMPSFRWGPVRYWARGFPKSPSNWARWKWAGEDAYRDDYFGRVMDSVDEKEGEWMAGAVSLHGRAEGNELGRAMREREIRVLFGLRSLQHWPPGLFRAPGQTLDVGPTLMGALQIPVATGLGRIFPLDKSGLAWDSSGAWVVRSAWSKVVVVDGRYKYVRRRFGPLSAGNATGPGRGRRTDFPKEEVFDLWADPGEKMDLARERRGLLARLRDVLDELDPDPVEVRVAFLNPFGDRIDGVVNCVQGELSSLSSSVGGRRMGAYEFVFSTNAVSGDVQFRTWPPLVPFRLRLLVNGKPLPPSQIQVGRWGIPLFEIKGDEWFDKTKFGWMDGWISPRTSTFTVVSLGRVSPIPEGETP